jgi:hypothetical protein
MTLLPVLALGLVSASHTFNTASIFDHLTSGSIGFAPVSAYQTTLGGTGMVSWMTVGYGSCLQHQPDPGPYLSEYVILTLKGASNVPTGSTVTGMEFHMNVASTGANDGAVGDPGNNVIQLYADGLVGTNEAGGHSGGPQLKEWDYGSSTTTWGEDPPRQARFLSRQNWRHSASIISGSLGGYPTFQIAIRLTFADLFSLGHAGVNLMQFGATLYYD